MEAADSGPTVTTNPTAITSLTEAADWLSETFRRTVRPYSSVDRWVSKGPPHVDYAELERIRDDESISIKVVREDAARELVREMREVCAPGIVPFLGVTTQRRLCHSIVELVVKEFSDELDIVRHMGTSAGNYRLKNSDIIAELSALRDESGMSILGAAHNRCDIATPPGLDKPWRLMDRLDAFCPDLLSQGSCSRQDLVAILSRGEAICLWWD